MCRRSSNAPLLTSIGLILLAIGWLFSNPPGSAPDEPAHYIRAVSVGQFNWLGQPTTQTVMRAENARQLALLDSIARLVAVPPRLAAPDSWYCTVIDHDASAACVVRRSPAPPPAIQPTYVGSYAPFAYVPYGLATRLGNDPTSALLWARLAGTIFSIAFVIVALWLLWVPGSPISIVGLTIALTPMVIFTSVVVSSSSFEVAGSVCFAAAAARLWREPGHRPSLYAAGVSAFVVGVARPLGPLWVFFGALLLAMLVRREGLKRVVSSAPIATTVLCGLVVVGVAVNVAWQLLVIPPAPRRVGEIVGFIVPSVGALPIAFAEAVGLFGWQDILMPRPAYALWGVAFVGLIAAALLLGRRRELRALEALLFFGVLLLIGISAVVVMPTGYAIRGRYILPAVVAMCVVAGEIVYRNRGRASASSLHTLVLGATLLAATLHVVGWYSMAHRYAVGARGSWFFLGHADWQPPLGWGAWLGVIVFGALSLAGGALVSHPSLAAPSRTSR